MRVGSAMLMLGLLAVVIGFLYRPSRMTMLKRLMRWLRIRRFDYLLMGSGPMRRLFRG